MIGRMCIVGVGLMGGSLARAARRAGLVEEIVGSGRNAAHLERARELGVIDRFDLDIAAAAAGCDLVVAAVPLGAFADVLRQLQNALEDGAVVTDVGSAKACVLEDARRVFGAVPPGLVPGHPIAGNEKSGVEASSPDLFRGRHVILTPVAETKKAAVDQVRELWERIGAEVVIMEAGQHDRVLAATSHLPHVLAFALVKSLARSHEHEEIFRFAGGGFEDFTRIAASDPVMWRDICLCNRDAILASLEHFGSDLAELTEAVRAGDGARLLTIFQRAKAAREAHGKT